MSYLPENPNQDNGLPITDQLIFLSADADFADVLETHEAATVKDKLQRAFSLIGIGTAVMEASTHETLPAAGIVALVVVNGIHARKNHIVMKHAEQTLNRIARERN